MKSLLHQLDSKTRRSYFREDSYLAYKFGQNRLIEFAVTLTGSTKTDGRRRSLDNLLSVRHEFSQVKASSILVARLLSLRNRLHPGD